MKYIRRVRFGFIFLILFEFLFLISTSSNSSGKALPWAEENPLPPLSLIGVIISENASSSLAILKNEKTGKMVMLRVGENILGLTLVQVFENRIVLQKENQNFQIFLGRGSLVRAQETPPEKPVQINEPPLKQGDILEDKKIESNPMKRELIKSEVLRRLEEEWSKIVNETKFVPNLVEGKVSGFKITSLPERTILSEVGIHKNDIIKEVNGVELNDMDTIFSLYNKFKDENHFEVSVEREGKLLRLLYILK